MKESIDHYLRVYKGRLKPSTWADYRSILLHHACRFEDLEDLNRNLEEYLSGLEISGKRKNNIIFCVRSFLEWAARREIYDGRIYSIPPFKYRPQKIKPLTAEETRLVIRYAPWPYKAFFQLSLLTGLRTGEALGLRFDDFDVANRVIKVKRSLTNGVVGLPKTESSIREVTMLRPVWELLEVRRRSNRKSSPWFFFSEWGGIMSPKNLRKKWKGFLEAFGIEYRRLYATRHTFASLALAAGENPIWVAKMLGHSGAERLYERDRAAALRQLFLSYADHIQGEVKDGEKFLKLLIGKETFMKAVN